MPILLGHVDINWPDTKIPKIIFVCNQKKAYTKFYVKPSTKYESSLDNALHNTFSTFFSSLKYGTCLRDNSYLQTSIKLNPKGFKTQLTSQKT